MKKIHRLDDENCSPLKLRTPVRNGPPRNAPDESGQLSLCANLFNSLKQ